MNLPVKKIKSPKDILFEEIVDIDTYRKTATEMGLTEVQIDNYIKALKKGWDFREKVIQALDDSVNELVLENLYLAKKLQSLGVPYEHGKVGRPAGDLTH